MKWDSQHSQSDRRGKHSGVQATTKVALRYTLALFYTMGRWSSGGLVPFQPL